MKLIFTVLALFVISITMAQKGTADGDRQIENKVSEEIERVDDIGNQVEDVGNLGSMPLKEINRFESVNSIKYNTNYVIESSINEQYDFYREKYTNESKVGIVTKSGRVILPHLFNRAYSNSNSKSEVVLRLNNNYGLFNLDNLRWGIPMEYEELSHLGNSLYSVRKNGKSGVVDNNNKMIVPFLWTGISSISNIDTYITVSTQYYPNALTGVYSLIEGKLTVPCIYSNFHQIDQRAYFIVGEGEKKNIVDIKNTLQFKNWYEQITTCSDGSNNYIVKLGDRFGVIDGNEKVLVPIEYLEFASYPLSDGSYLARNKAGKYGFMTINGKVTLPFEYDNLTKSNNDKIISVQKGKCGLVNISSGAPIEIATCDYDAIKVDTKVFIVEKAKQFGLMDMYGKLITAIEFDSIEVFQGSYRSSVIFCLKKKGTCQLINEQGNKIGDAMYTNCSVILKNNRSSYNSTNEFSYIKAQVKGGNFCIVDKVGVAQSKALFEDIISESESIFIVKSKGKYGLYALFGQKLLNAYEYDLILKTDDKFYGFVGDKIDILVVNSDQVTKYPTTTSTTTITNTTK